MLVGMMRLLFISASIGTVLGYLGARVLFVGSFLSLVPWTIAGLCLGYGCFGFRRAVANGAVYGFLLAFIFMLAGYQGSFPILTRLPFFAALGLVGAVCGLILGVGGAWLRRLTGRIRP